MEKVQIGNYSLTSKGWSHISDDAKKFIKNLLEYDPKKRFDANTALNDIWIKKMHSTSNEVEKNLAVSILSNLRDFRVLHCL